MCRNLPGNSMKYVRTYFSTTNLFLEFVDFLNSKEVLPYGHAISYLEAFHSNYVLDRCEFLSSPFLYCPIVYLCFDALFTSFSGFLPYFEIFDHHRAYV